jgi:hypothetical protein
MKTALKPIIVLMVMALGVLSSCNKFPFGDDDPTPECIDKSKIKENAMCTQQYDPVCGCNKVTYPNACVAQAAGVTRYTKGACDGYRRDIFTYSYTGSPMVDGCGSVFTDTDGNILIPEDETQIPDSIKHRQTFAPAKYIVEYTIVGYNDKFQCGINPETKKATIIRVRRMIPV